MKKWLAVILTLCMVMSLAACGKKEEEPAKAPAEVPAETPAEIPAEEPKDRVFVDSLGCEVTIPAQIDKIAVSGPMAQIVLFALCPDKLVGIANEWNAGSELILDQKYYELPVLGQLYGGKGELNLETLLSSEAQVVIDVGQPKGDAAGDLDALQAQTGLPFIHITADTATAGEAYRTLGELLGMEAEAEALAEYYEGVYQTAVDLSERVEKTRLLYVTGSTGQNVIAKDAYHAEIIDLLSDNQAVVDSPSSKGTGNEVSMEQILLWDPDVILFSSESCFDTVADDPAWQEVTAIRNGTYYEVPFSVYNWMGFPPSVQRCPGMLWMGKLLYPEAAEYDLYESVAEYYELFYHSELPEDLYSELVANSIGKQAG